jgi:peptide/nickel transport system substrate-binding protein
VDSPEGQAVAAAIKKNWEALGIKVDVEVKQASHIQKETIHARAYDALIYGEIIGPDSDPYPFWHSSQAAAPGLNLSGFSNRRADEIMEQNRKTTDSKARDAAYRELQDIIADEVPAIFLYRPAYTYAVSRDINGINPGLIFTPADRFAGISDWYINTKKVWK